MRKVCYITGTRADFGLMTTALQAINDSVDLQLQIIVTGMHLLDQYGNTWQEIENNGLPIIAKVPVELSGELSGVKMSHALGKQIILFTEILQQNSPDILLLLGDRGEMLAGAIAALHLNIPIAHIHGGELSGTIDESMRHAISKLAHYHFTSTQNAKDRLIKMGENQDHIFVTGAPGLDAIVQTELLAKNELFNEFELDKLQPYIMVVFHPIVQHSLEAGQQMKALLDAVIATGNQLLVLMPNSDAGSDVVRQIIIKYDKKYENLHCVVHIERSAYLSLLAYAEVLVGNSSSGIIEAASLATPVVNIGNRQNGRERNKNIIDCKSDSDSILMAIQKAIKLKDKNWNNIYGDGKSSIKITQLLANVPLTRHILDKANAY